ncbi:MAG: hypothetical protein JO353_00015 [Phycisphaerae bacterium]|nr:hypothetical protein [Phycisphaerae bacterium]
MISLILAVAVIVVGLIVVEGCIYIPTFNATVRGKNATNIVGSAQSDRPLRVGMATLRQVRNALGLQYWSATTKNSYSYMWEVQNGLWVGPLCYIPQHGVRTMTFEFDDSGILRAFHVTSWDDNGDFIGLGDPDHLFNEH